MRRTLTLLLLIAGLALLGGAAQAQTSPVTVAVDLDPSAATGMRPEGLVADRLGRLYTSDLDSRRLFRITPASKTIEVLMTLPQPATGMAVDSAGNLFLASGSTVLRIAADRLAAAPFDPSTAVDTVAQGVAGANGLAFDAGGRLFVSGGATGNVYLVTTAGVTSTVISGLASDRPEQLISANGLAFGPDGMLYIANTGTGAIERAALNADGTAAQLERYAQSALLLGADGIAFGSNGDLFVCANERNAVVRITPAREVSDVASNGNAGPLEFPASPAFVGTTLFVSNFDVERGANTPAAAGVGASVASLEVGVTGAPLPFTPAPPPTATAPVIPTPEPTATATLTATVEGTPALTATPELTATATLTATVEVTPELTATATITTTDTAPATLPNTGDAASTPGVALVGLALVALAGAALMRAQGRRARP